MDLEKLVEVVDDMTVQHSYPGFDIRTLKLGLPASVLKAPPKVYGAALKHENVMVRLAALRWFWEKPGPAKPFARVIVECLSDPDDVVRAEAVRCLERISNLDKNYVVKIAELLKDPFPEVRKAAAKGLGKIGIKDEVVIENLREAADDPDHEVKWKAQKALRQLGAYVA